MYDTSEQRKGSIALGTLTPPELGRKLYSNGAISDVHVQYDTAASDFQKALSYAETHCDFTCIAGDLTNSGAVEDQLAVYKSIVDTFAITKPVYAIAGNHEHYDNYSHSYLEQYTGYPLYYSFTKGNDVFIMVGHYGGYKGDGIGWLADETWSAEELKWLYETLEANRNRRCFVFTHVLPHEHGVGNPNNLYVTSKKPALWYTNDAGNGQSFISLLRHYQNTILFHGHSHTRFRLQELDEKANYSDVDGYRSVHIPSLAMPRDFLGDGEELADCYVESEGYIVDVYEDGVILRGRDFVNDEFLPIATYYIDTTLQEIPEESDFLYSGMLPDGTTYRVNQRYSESAGGIVNTDGYAMLMIPCVGDGVTSYVLQLKNTNIDISKQQSMLFLLNSDREIAGTANGSKYFCQMSGVTKLEDGTVQVEFTPSVGTSYIALNIAERSDAPIFIFDINDYGITLARSTGNK